MRSKRSVNCCVGERWACASVTILTTRAIVDCSARRATITSMAPLPLMVPAKTRNSDPSLSNAASAALASSVGRLSTGTLSPVTGAWLTLVVPTTTTPSAGSLSFGRTKTTSPNCNSPTAILCVLPSRRTVAVSGASSAKASMARRARPIAYCSSECPMPNRNSNSAPSAHLPSAAAPMAATSVRVSMAKRRSRRFSKASLAVNQPPNK